MVEAGIPFNLQDGTKRQYNLISNYLDLLVQNDGSPSASRKTVDISEGALNAAEKQTK